MPGTPPFNTKRSGAVFSLGFLQFLSTRTSLTFSAARRKKRRRSMTRTLISHTCQMTLIIRKITSFDAWTQTSIITLLPRITCCWRDSKWKVKPLRTNLRYSMTRQFKNLFKSRKARMVKLPSLRQRRKQLKNSSLFYLLRPKKLRQKKWKRRNPVLHQCLLWKPMLSPTKNNQLNRSRNLLKLPLKGPIRLHNLNKVPRTICLSMFKAQKRCRSI